MKKKIICALLIAMVTMSMAGCGNSSKTEDVKEESAEKTENVESEVEEINADEYVTLGEYEGANISVKPIVTITEVEVEDYIQGILEVNWDQKSVKEVTDRAVQDGDITNIDYTGIRDGVAFKGGTDKGYDLDIGSGAFIPGFEEGLIGANIGETLDVPLTFPETYDKEMAGAEVVFTVTVNAIKEKILPELTDEFVSGLANVNYKTVEELRAYVKSSLEENAKVAYENGVKAAVWDYIWNASTVSEPPKSLVDRSLNRIIQNAQSEANQNQVDLDTFIETNMETTREEFDKYAATIATNSAKEMLIYMAVAKKAGIEVTEADIQRIAEDEMAASGITSVDEYLKLVDMESFKEYILVNLVMDHMIENVVITDDIADTEGNPEEGNTEDSAEEGNTEGGAEDEGNTKGGAEDEGNTEGSTEGESSTKGSTEGEDSTESSAEGESSTEVQPQKQE